MPVTLNYQTFGEGKPIIILHGLLGSSRNWSSIAKRLSSSHQVITADLRNHGESEHAEEMSYEDLANDVLHLIENLGLDKTTIIGHSMGGKTAMVSALLNPSLIDQLIILDIAPVTYDHKYGDLFSALKQLPLETISNRKEADEHLAAALPEAEAGLRQFLLQNLVKEGERYRWRINLAAIIENIPAITDFPFTNLADSYPGKSLFLSGENSEYILDEHHPVIRQYFPEAEIYTIEKAGHWIQADNPGAVLEKIMNFL